MSEPTVLIVEDDTDLREALRDIIEQAGYRVWEAANGRTALDRVQGGPPDMVISDVQMEGMDGHALLRHLKRLHPELPVVLITAYGSIERAVEAMRDGAVDYLVKPFEAEVVVHMVSRYAQREPAPSELVAEDPKSRELAALARRVAASDATVMITGESGSGKEVFARYIHDHSPRARRLFVAINCAAIPENMLEAVLFGYEKGAFTGAYKACPGKFEQANGGTLLLDEISEMDLGLQAKLLRVLQEREVERLGGNKLISLDVRVLATSNRDMRRIVAEGRFREDLYYRLNVFPLDLPPLRDRPGDIVPLANHLLRRRATGHAPLPEFSPEAEAALCAHSWPGNVRELDNVVQRALILHSDGLIRPEDLFFESTAASTAPAAAEPVREPEPELEASMAVTAPPRGGRLGETLRSREHRLILQALEEGGGSRKYAAEKLGISQRTLRYKLARMREAGIEIPAPRAF